MNDIQQIQYFDKGAHRYEFKLLEFPPRHVKAEINNIVQILKKHNLSNIVDFGSGNGRLSIPLLQMGYSVFAVDISPQSLNDLKINARRLKCDKKLQTFFKIPINKQVEAVVGTDILHHVDLTKSLITIHRALIKKGIIVFSEPNFLNPAWVIFITLFLTWSIEWRIIYCNYFSLMFKLKKSGFSHIQIKGLGLLPLPFGNRSTLISRLNLYLGNLPILKLFAYRYIIYARK